MGAEEVTRFLDLLVLPTATRRRRHEALVDYSKSILLTSEQYIETMELKAKKKEDALIEAARRREEVCNRRAVQALEKERKKREKAQKAAEARAKENFHQQWTTEAIREAGKRLQYLMKNPGPLPPPGSRIAPFCGILPAICKKNMARRLAKRRCIKFGGNSSSIEPSIPPLWVHLYDPRYADLESCKPAKATDGRNFQSAGP